MIHGTSPLLPLAGVSSSLASVPTSSVAAGDGHPDSVHWDPEEGGREGGRECVST